MASVNSVEKLIDKAAGYSENDSLEDPMAKSARNRLNYHCELSRLG